MTKNDSTPASFATTILNFIRKKRIKGRILVVNKYVYNVDRVLHKMAKIKMLKNIWHIFRHFLKIIQFQCKLYVNRVIHIEKYEHMLISMWIMWKIIHLATLLL